MFTACLLFRFALAALPAPVETRCGPTHYPATVTAVAPPYYNSDLVAPTGWFATPAATPAAYVAPSSVITPSSLPPLNPGAPVANEALVKELVGILNETRSRDTFCMTVQLLGTMKADGKLVVPAILRNAERLKISTGMLKSDTEWTTQQEIVGRSLQFFLTGRESPGITDRWGEAATPASHVQPAYPPARR